MKWIKGLWVCVLAMTICAQGFSQVQVDPQTGQAPPPKPAAIEGKAMPLNEFNGQSLDAALKALHEKMPDFNSVVLRNPGVDDDYPRLENVSLQGVTVGQFLEFLKRSYPGVTLDRIDGPTAPIYVVHIEAVQTVPNNQEAAAAEQQALMANLVTVYKLSPIIDSLSENMDGDRAANAKKALNDVLSLIQSAMDQTTQSKDVMLKVHEPTQTLMFKGTPEQRAVLQEIITTLTPDPNDAQAKARNQVRDAEAKYNSEISLQEDKIQTLQNQLGRQQDQYDKMRQLMEQAKLEQQMLQAKLEQQDRSTTKP